MKVIEVTYFSDVLCVWAYVSQARMAAVEEKFGDSVRIKHRFCSVFGDTAEKIKLSWKEKGGYEGFNLHLRHVAEKFPHIQVHPDIWLKTRPASSASPHLFLKAVQLWDRDSKIFDQVMWAFRSAFFRDCRDISRWDVQCEIAEGLGANIRAIEELIHSGVAFASLAADYQDADKMRIEGSPSLVLNDGRQKLYGNVGFRLIDANIQELFREPLADDASWC
ncbi:MAG: DsbA family protein [Xanthobacteraceae bacterium]